jgi:hypothetical protein
MEKHNARRQRRRAESVVSARGVSSREGCEAFDARSVAAAGAALRPAAMQIADHSGVFFICVPAPYEEFLDGSEYGESTI